MEFDLFMKNKMPGWAETTGERRVWLRCTQIQMLQQSRTPTPPDYLGLAGGGQWQPQGGGPGTLPCAHQNGLRVALTD